jgi:trehalose/maltose transport system substrate-binding protein
MRPSSDGSPDWQARLRRVRRTTAALLAAGGVAIAVAACGGSSKEEGATKSISASAKQTITFALAGLGSEGEATQAAVKKFEAANPNIKVKLEILSSNSTTYLQQLQTKFEGGSSTPDLFESDVTYPAKFAQAGWIKPLTSFKPETSKFFETEMEAGEYEGAVYAIPWFDNPEGLFYRTDMIMKAPESPEELVEDAEKAMAQHHELKEGLAFEGHKYEGAITSFLTVAPAFGGKLTPEEIDTKGNVEALNWLHEALYVNKIAPTAVTGWEEGQVEEEFTSGHTPFAIDYPFVASVAEEGGPAKGKFAYVPFPAGPNGEPGAALGGEMLGINAKTEHAAAAYKLIEYLTTPAVQITRAEECGDPPSLPAAYTQALYEKAPVFEAVKTLNGYAQPRPVSPQYLQISEFLQDAFSSVYANSTSAKSALEEAASRIESLEA